MIPVRLPHRGVRACWQVARLLGADTLLRSDHPPLILQRTLFRRIYRPRSAISLARINGITLLFPAVFFAPLARRGFDRLTTDRVRRYLQPGMVAVDVGAHAGYYTLLFSELVRPGGGVHAVEPAPANLALLRANLERHHAGNVTIHTCAAGASSGRRTFALTQLGDTNSLYDHPLAPAVERIVVDVTPLDALLTGPAHLIKVDVEGAELDVLAGMPQVLAASRAMAMVIEWNPACLGAAGRDALELPRALTDLGFSVTVIDEQEGTAEPLAAFLANRPVDALPPTWFANLWAERP